MNTIEENIMRLKGTSALLLGALATATGISVAIAAGWSPPSTGSWQCYRTDRFSDPARDPARGPRWDPAWAASDDGAKAFAEGLNQVAKNSAVGTVLTVQAALGVRSPLICVKY